MSSAQKPRAYTENEVRNKLLDEIWMLIDYWHNAERSDRERMEGLAFSILSALDGASLGLPKFIVAPDPHPHDKGWNQSEGENYFPENYALPIHCDIAGGLHELFYGRKPKK